MSDAVPNLQSLSVAGLTASAAVPATARNCRPACQQLVSPSTKPPLETANIKVLSVNSKHKKCVFTFMTKY